MAFKGVFQPKRFHDSVIPNTAVQEVVISNRFKAALLAKGRGATCSPWQLPMCGVFEMLLFPWCSVQLHQTSLFFFHAGLLREQHNGSCSSCSAVQCGVHVSRLTGLINIHFLVKFPLQKLGVNQTKGYCRAWFSFFKFFLTAHRFLVLITGCKGMLHRCVPAEPLARSQQERMLTTARSQKAVFL